MHTLFWILHNSAGLKTRHKKQHGTLTKSSTWRFRRNKQHLDSGQEASHDAGQETAQDAAQKAAQYAAQDAAQEAAYDTGQEAAPDAA